MIILKAKMADHGSGDKYKPSPDFYFGKARAYQEMNNDFEAQKMYERVLFLSPKHVLAQNLYGDFLKDNAKNEGDLRNALSHFEAAIENDDEFVWAYCNKGFIHIMLGEYNEAKNSYEIAIKLDGKHRTAFWGLGTALFYKNEFKQALVYLKEGSEMDRQKSVCLSDGDEIFMDQSFDLLTKISELGKKMDELGDEFLPDELTIQLNRLKIDIHKDIISKISMKRELRTNNNSYRIDKLEKVVDGIQSWISTVDSKLNGLKINYEFNDEEISILKVRLIKVENEFRNSREKLDYMITILENSAFISLYKRAQEEEKQKIKEEEIEADSYRNVFYKTLKTQLNSYYVAAQVVSTNIVMINPSASTPGTFSSIFSSIKAALQKCIEILFHAGKSIPMLGIGFDLFSQFLEMVGKEQVRFVCDRYLGLASSESDMDSKISVPVATNLALKSQLTNIVDLRNTEGFFSKLSSICKKIRGNLAPRKIKEKVKKYFNGFKEVYDKEAEYGKKDALIISGLIISKIYEDYGNNENIPKSQQLFDYIVSYRYNT